MEHKNQPENGQSTLSTTTTPPAAQAPQGFKKGGKTKKPDKSDEETTPLTVSLPKSLVRQIKIVVAATDQSSSEWLADVLRPVLKREVAKVVSGLGE